MQSGKSAWNPKPYIEPLGFQHDRAAFSSGVSYVDILVSQALSLQEAGLCRAYVAVWPDSTKVLGMYSLSPHGLEAWQIPEKYSELVDAHNLQCLPAAYISVFGVQKSLQGQGLGRWLFADALRRIKAAQAGSLPPFVVVLDAIDERSEIFYTKFQFQRVPNFHGRRLYYPVSEIG